MRIKINRNVQKKIENICYNLYLYLEVLMIVIKFNLIMIMMIQTMILILFDFIVFDVNVIVMG